MSECKGFKDQTFFILWGRGSENFRGNIWFSWRTEGEVGLVVAKRVQGGTKATLPSKIRTS